jgi:hypothetical protein
MNMILALVVAAQIVTLNCASTPDRTPEGVVADYGLKLTQSVEHVQEAVGEVGKSSTNQQVKEGAIAALQAIQKVNDLSETLADKLAVINQARTGGGDVADGPIDEVLALVDQIDAALDLEIIPKLGAYPETRAALDAARAVSKLLLAIQLEMGRVQ